MVVNDNDVIDDGPSHAVCLAICVDDNLGRAHKDPRGEGGGADRTAAGKDGEGRGKGTGTGRWSYDQFHQMRPFPRLLVRVILPLRGRGKPGQRTPRHV